MDTKKRRGLKVRAMLVERGIKLKTIAERLSLDQSTISQVVAGKRQSRRVKRAVAEALGVSPKSLWPDEFNNNRKAA